MSAYTQSSSSQCAPCASLRLNARVAEVGIAPETVVRHRAFALAGAWTRYAFHDDGFVVGVPQRRFPASHRDCRCGLCGCGEWRAERGYDDPVV